VTEKRVISQADVDEKPYLLWNTFVDILAKSEREQLAPNQVPAFLVFWYESEVQNGGHFQYFENHGLDQVEATVDALRKLGAKSQAEVLARAYAIASDRSWGEITDVEEFVSETLDSGLDLADSDFHACVPSLMDVLEAHLDAHPDWYVDVVAG